MTPEELQYLQNNVDAPADNIKTGYVKSSNAPTSGGVSNVIEGDDIDTQISQLPEEYASWRSSSVPGYADLIRKSDGAVLQRTKSSTFSDADLIKMGLSFIPGMAPFVAGYNALDAARRGDIVGAIIGGTGLVPGMENINTALKVGKAVDDKNIFGAITAAAGNTDLQKFTGLNNVNFGDGSISAKDVMKGVGTAKALTSGNNPQVLRALMGLVNDQGGNLKSSIGPGNMDQFSEDLIEGYFKPGGQGYIDPTTGEMTVQQEPDNLDAFLRSLYPYAADDGISVFKQAEDIPEMETVSNRPITSLDSIFGDTNILQDVPDADVPEMVITDDRETPYVPGIRTKDIVSDIPDEITPDQIDKLFPDFDFNSLLQTVTTPGGTKTVVPGGTKTTTPGTTTTQQALSNLGLNAPMPSQDPYANIKLMEELFGGNTDYKLRSLGAPKNLASADIDALARMLRG